jgi:hypothetical protein
MFRAAAVARTGNSPLRAAAAFLTALVNVRHAERALEHFRIFSFRNAEPDAALGRHKVAGDQVDEGRAAGAVRADATRRKLGCP